MTKMYVHSGDCRLCECGLDTDLTTWNDEPLKTGDIVFYWKGDYISGVLSVVVSDQFQSFSDGSIVEKEATPVPYIMGIKNAPSGEWSVIRVKSVDDVIDGEHWKAWGFCYRAASKSGDAL